MKTLELAIGRWYGILTAFGIDERYLQNRHGPCPLCEGRDRFRFDDKDGTGSYYCNGCGAGDGVKLLMQWKGWEFKQAASEIDKIIGNIEAKKWQPKPDPAVRLRNIAKGLQSAEGTPVEHYLRSRVNITSMPDDVKYHPGVRYYNEKQQYIDTFPSMVSLVRNADGKPATYHITYLSLDGRKAPVDKPKKILTPVKTFVGGGVRLMPAGSVIGVAEGIETALAASVKFNLPCWSCISDNGLSKFVPPESVTTVMIFGDNDLSYAGQAAAYALAKRLAQKYTVSVHIPVNKQSDWADDDQLLKQFGKFAKTNSEIKNGD